jgi:serine phosphatase RsbU (regulator of sigma subunit)
VQSIEGALDEFSSGAPADDDRTLLVLKRVDPARA